MKTVSGFSLLFVTAGLSLSAADYMNVQGYVDGTCTGPSIGSMNIDFSGCQAAGELHGMYLQVLCYNATSIYYAVYENSACAGAPLWEAPPLVAFPHVCGPPMDSGGDDFSGFFKNSLSQCVSTGNASGFTPWSGDFAAAQMNLYNYSFSLGPGETCNTATQMTGQLVLATNYCVTDGLSSSM